MPPNDSPATPRPLTTQTLAGFFWTLSGTGGQAGLQLIVLTVLARLLTPEDFGVVAVAIIIVGFTGTFSELGIGPAIVQRPHLDTRHLRSGFTITLVFGTVAFGLVHATSPAIASFFAMEALTPVLRVIAVLFLIRSVTVISEKLLQRELAFRTIAAVQVVSYFVGFGVVGVALALMGMGVWALVAAYLAQAAIACLILLRVRPFPMRPQLDGPATRELLAFGGGFTLARIFNQIALQGDNFVVGRWLGAAALGLYGRAYQLMTMPASLFGTALDKVLFPVMAKVQHRQKLLATAYRRGVALIALLALPASAVLILLAPEFILVLLGPQWVEAIVPFQVLAVGMLFRTSYKMSDSLARATGAVYRRAWRQGVYAVAIVGAAWVGHHWGIVGVTMGIFFALALNFSLMAHLSLSLTKLPLRAFVGVHLRAVPLTAVSAVAAWGAAALLRDAGAAPFLVLSGGGLAALAAVAALTALAAEAVLGQDGIWLLRSLSKYLPQRYRRIVSRVRWLRS